MQTQTAAAANGADDILLRGDAARLVEQITHRRMSSDSLRYHEDRGRIRFMCTTSGVRLFRRADVVDFARRLAGEDEPADLAS